VLSAGARAIGDTVSRAVLAARKAQAGPYTTSPDCLLIEYWCTRTPSPHPPPWPEGERV
jgi:hypothetical protein